MSGISIQPNICVIPYHVFSKLSYASMFPNAPTVVYSDQQLIMLTISYGHIPDLLLLVHAGYIKLDIMTIRCAYFNATMSKKIEFVVWFQNTYDMQKINESMGRYRYTTTRCRKNKQHIRDVFYGPAGISHFGFTPKWN
jgi:hypothetical protein